MPLQGRLSVERMCRLAPVSRAGFYRSFKEQMPLEEDMEVRSAIQEVALEHRRRYGYRRLSQRRGSPQCRVAIRGDIDPRSSSRPPSSKRFPIS